MSYVYKMILNSDRASFLRKSTKILILTSICILFFWLIDDVHIEACKLSMFLNHTIMEFLIIFNSFVHKTRLSCRDLNAIVAK